MHVASKKKRILLNRATAMEIYQHKIRLTVPMSYKASILSYHSKVRGESSVLAKQYGVSPKTIRDIWNRKSWTEATAALWHLDQTKVCAKVMNFQFIGLAALQVRVCVIIPVASGSSAGRLTDQKDNSASRISMALQCICSNIIQSTDITCFWQRRAEPISSSPAPAFQCIDGVRNTLSHSTNRTVILLSIAYDIAFTDLALEKVHGSAKSNDVKIFAWHYFRMLTGFANNDMAGKYLELIPAYPLLPFKLGYAFRNWKCEREFRCITGLDACCFFHMKGSFIVFRVTISS